MEQKINKDEEAKKFELFLFELDAIVESFRNAALKQGRNLDLSMHSLSELEDYLLAEIDSLPEEERRPLIGWAARYYGEVVRHKYGGKWILSIDDPNDLYYGLPVIIGHAKGDIEFAPSEMILNLLTSRKKGLLQQIVQSHVAPERIGGHGNLRGDTAIRESNKNTLHV